MFYGTIIPILDSLTIYPLGVLLYVDSGKFT